MFDAYLFDLDGTIFVGDTLLPGALEKITYLRSQGKQIRFLTNTTVQTRVGCMHRLQAMGLMTTAEEIVTAAYMAAVYFRELEPAARVLVIGEQPMAEELDQLQINRTDQSPAATHVLVGMDRKFSYEKLNAAMQAIRGGARLVVANPDPVCPVPGGAIPDTGALAKAIEIATEQPVQTVVGKPSFYYAQKVLQHLGLPGERCLMVGDRLETDILLGRRSGMNTALVLTGVTSMPLLEKSSIQPDFVLATLDELSLS